MNFRIETKSLVRNVWFTICASHLICVVHHVTHVRYISDPITIFVCLAKKERNETDEIYHSPSKSTLVIIS